MIIIPFIPIIDDSMQAMCANTTPKHRDMERSTTFRLGEEEM